MKGVVKWSKQMDWYAGTAKEQADYLFLMVPKTNDGTIRHMEFQLWCELFICFSRLYCAEKWTILYRSHFIHMVLNMASCIMAGESLITDE